jgi:hypothetical protein
MAAVEKGDRQTRKALRFKSRLDATESMAIETVVVVVQ